MLTDFASSLTGVFTESCLEFIVDRSLLLMHLLFAVTCICAAAAFCRKLQLCKAEREAAGNSAGTDGSGKQKYSLRFFAVRYWDSVSALLIIAAAMWLRFGAASFSPKVFYDELNFWGLARGFYEYGLYAIFCEHPLSMSELPIPPGCSYALFWAFKCMGVSLAALQVSASVTAGLSLFLLWRLGRALWPSSRLTALILLFCFACLPVHIRLSGCTALENGSFMCLMAFLLHLAWLGRLYVSDGCAEGGGGAEPGAESPSAGSENAADCVRKARMSLCRALMYGTAVWAAWMSCWRMENLPVIIPLFMAAFFLSDTRRMRLFREPHFYGAALVFAILSIPGLLCDVYGMAAGYYLNYKPADELREDVINNYYGNLVYWVNNSMHPVVLSAGALLGICVSSGMRRFVWLTAWTVLMGFYCEVPSADFSLTHTLDSWRNAVIPVFIVTLMFCEGLEAVLRGTDSPGRKAAYAGLAAAAMAANASMLWGFVVSTNPLIAEFRMLEKAAPYVNASCRPSAVFDKGWHGSCGLPAFNVEADIASGGVWFDVFIDDTGESPAASRFICDVFRWCQDAHQKGKPGILLFCSLGNASSLEQIERRMHFYKKYFRYKILPVSEPGAEACLLIMLEGLTAEGDRLRRITEEAGAQL